MASPAYQFHHPWHWLTYGENATAVAVFVSFCVGIVTIGVLMRTFVAVKKQAEAADRQARAAEEQANAARKQAEVAEQQRLLAQRATMAAEEQVKASAAATKVSEAHLAAAEESARTAQLQNALIRNQILAQMRPVLVIKKEITEKDFGPRFAERYVVQNHGQGVALDISAAYRRPPSEPIQITLTILGPGQSAEINASHSDLPKRGLQFRYRSQDGRHFSTYAEPWVNSTKGIQQITIEIDEKGGWLADAPIPE